MSASSRKLLKELPSAEVMQERLLTLLNQSDQAIALAGPAYLDHALETLLEARFRTLSREDRARMFDGAQGGILGTASAKIRLAFAMELIRDETYRDLLLINDIRNVFAHTLHHCDFDSPLIAQDCAKLSSFKPDVFAAIQQTARQRFVHNILTLYVEILERVKPLAMAKALRKSPTGEQ